MNNKYKFIYKIIIKNTIGKCLSYFIKRKNNYCILSCRTDKDHFMHNTKYLFLYLSQIKGLNPIWLSDNSDMIKIFKQHGYKNVYSRRSIMGIYYTLLSKYWLYDFSPNSISNYYSNNAICINLWHGIPLKKIEHDAQTTIYNKLNDFQKNIYEKYKTKDDFYVVNNTYEQSCYETAFLAPKEKIKIIGSPRLDVLLHDIKDSELFMEKDFNNIKTFKRQNKKIFIYMPTFRDTGKNISTWLYSKELKKQLQINNAILICKLHPYDKNTLNIPSDDIVYKMDNNSDVYPILKYTDALITDYSSIYFDYLLLDKPILYYVPDLEEYQQKCRGFYAPYTELTAGMHITNEQDFIIAIRDIINDIDNYKEKRKILRDKMFKYQDGYNCERIVKWLKALE